MKTTLPCWRRGLLLALVCLGTAALSAQTPVPIKNPTFADTDGDGIPDGWQPYPPADGTTRILAAKPGGGLIFKDDDKTNGLGLQQWIPVQAGVSYTASATVSGNGSVSLCFFFVAKIPARAGDLRRVTISQKVVSAKAGQTTDLTAVAPAGANWVKLWFYCPKIGVTDVVIDKVAMTATGAPTPAEAPETTSATPAAAPAAPAGPAPKGNLLKNPDLADADGDGTPDGWNPYPPADGALRVLAPAPGGGLVFKDNDKNNGLGLEQWVPVQAGLRYTATANVSGDGSVGFYLIFAREKPARAGDLKSVELATKSGRAKAGAASEVSGIAPAGAQWMKVWLYSPKIGVTDVVLHHVTLTASTPEATAAATAAAAPQTRARPLPPGLTSVIDFETGDFSQARVTEGGDVSVISRAQGPVRDGNFAAKSNVRHTQHRAEISSERSPAYGVARYGWSIFVPKEFDAQTFFSIITQWHSWGSGRESPKDGGPPTCISVSKGKVQLKLLHQGDDGWTSKATYFPICSIEDMRNQWTDFVMEVNWQAPGNGGWLKLYKNDKLVVDYKGTTWYQDKDKGPYFKFGCYKGGSTWRGTEEGAVLYFDSARMAVGDSSTYKMVDPATYAPRPQP